MDYTLCVVIVFYFWFLYIYMPCTFVYLYWMIRIIFTQCIEKEDYVFENFVLLNKL